MYSAVGAAQRIPRSRPRRADDFGEKPGAEIAVVEAPMGLGKTEIALSLAAQAIRAQTASGLYVALPTQASSNALFGRVERFADRMRAPDAEMALTLAHGARQFHRDFRRMLVRTRRTAWERASAGPDDAVVPAEMTAPGWLQSSKRSLLAPVGLGTVDQAMLAAMSVRHGFVRLFALAGKTVVLDEIHAYDVYMQTILAHLLRWLSALGCKVVLLSATLPQGGRQALLDAFGAEAPDEGEPDTVPYPQVVWAAPGRAAQVVTRPVPAGLHQTVHVETIETDDATAAGVAWACAPRRRAGAWRGSATRSARRKTPTGRSARRAWRQRFCTPALHGRTATRRRRPFLDAYGPGDLAAPRRGDRGGDAGHRAVGRRRL